MNMGMGSNPAVKADTVCSPLPQKPWVKFVCISHTIQAVLLKHCIMIIPAFFLQQHHHHHQFLNGEGRWGTTDAVSYTHLTLPTSDLV